MSLTSEAKKANSPVGIFLREVFRETRDVLADIRQVRTAPILDLLPSGAGAAYSQVGIAVDYRARYHFSADPRSGSATIAEKGAAVVTRAEDDTMRLPPHLIGSTFDEFSLSWECVAGFFDELDQSVAQIQAHRRHPSPADERQLARFCLLLAAFEAIFRGGPRAWPPPWFGSKPPGNADEMLELVPDEWVQDAAALGAAFAERYPSWHGNTEATLNPTFVGSADVGGADADFIVDRCLWDIKTQRRHGRAWLDQLLGYVLLDYGDAYSIEQVGLVLPRHNTEIRWPLAELITRMSGDPGLELAALRERFRALCEQLREERES